MNTLLEILKGTIYVIVSLAIIGVLGVIYLGFVIFEVTKELVRYINRRIQ